MRAQSFAMIIVLCLAILLVDVLSFYWLQSITSLLASGFLRNIIYILFWTFTLGLISAILVLRVRLQYLHPKQKQLFISSLFGLTVSSFIPKLIFVVVISILYFSNYFFSEKESRLVIPLVGLAAGFVPFFVVVYGIFKTLYRFKVHRIQLHFRHLPQSFDGLRIVHISDLHLGSFNSRYQILERAVEQINKLNPDLILFTGDLVNNYAWELKGWSSVLNKLSARQGKFSVLGNHDYGDYSKWKCAKDKRSNFESIKYFHKKIGFRLLLNEAVTLKSESDELAILGVENWGMPPFKQYGDLSSTLERVSHIPFKILLSHDPSHWAEEVLENTDIALTLSGHTHGMQAGVKIRKKQWSPIKYRYKHWAGLYGSGDQYLYVNRGLGWLGFPGRIGIRPEITFIEFGKDRPLGKPADGL